MSKKIIMFKENYFENGPDFFCINLSQKFGTPRKYKTATFHAGEDWNSMLYKNQVISNLFYGKAIEIQMNDINYHGKFVIVKSNFEVIGGIDDNFFVMYKHLFHVSIIADNNNYIEPGKIIGYMGNSGYCLTYDNKIDDYRLLTEKEKNDSECMRGVHNHYECQQKVKKHGYQTKLLKELKKLELIKNDSLENYFYRGKRLFINPNILMEYARMLQG